MSAYKFTYGQKIRFASEKRPYTIRACDERFAICTKPFNLKKTVLYTIVDLKKNVRGTENLLFCPGYETDLNCRKALERLQNEDSHITAKNFIKLDILSLSK